MKAAVFVKYGPPEVVQIKEVEKPVPGDDEVLVKIKATTVTAVDYIFRSGKDTFARLATGVFKPKSNVLGSELSGIVESIGKDVTHFEKGDTVFADTNSGNDAHAEYICMPENGPLLRKPHNLTFEESAAVSYGALTALHFIRDNAKIENGTKVLIIGASGSVGTYSIQLAKYYGAEVAGVCSVANTDLIKSLGADKVIDYKTADFTKSGEKWDVIFDTVGKSSFSKSKRVLNPKGIFLTTYISLPILFQMIWTSVFGGKKAKIAFAGLRPTDEKAKNLKFIKELLEAGKLKPVIDRSYPFEQIVEAHRYVETGHKKGNVIITFGN